MRHFARFHTICTTCKKVPSTYGGVLLSVKLKAKACNFTKSNIAPWVFFTIFKFYKWYQIAQSVTYSTREMGYAIAQQIMISTLPYGLRTFL